MENCNVYRISLIREKSIKYQANVSTAEQAAEIIRKTITECGQSDREQMIVLMLDIKNRIIGTNIVSIGSVSSSIVCLRELFKPVILANSVALIVAHNHPSGDLQPSNEDNNITKWIFIGAHLLGLTLHDHLIISTENKEFYSYAENNILKEYKEKGLKKLKEF
ncbi:DNA repair protein RadC (plasmid) [Desulfosarcina sp. BuS5]|uniref:JAB domain-containing protein n=1 Tax=Desulfosarcina sp. BuS5 TaxID=933262 RepID=UPI00047FB609|nr:JAB domain-containing protein [Desulfosarcina sp. BuS5]WDN91035.1 DNA repair protein RadC [Desulfosarcina sp. BuS5]